MVVVSLHVHLTNVLKQKRLRGFLFGLLFGLGGRAEERGSLVFDVLFAW